MALPGRWSEPQSASPGPSTRIRCPQCGSFLRELAYAPGAFTVLACGPCGESFRLNSATRAPFARERGVEVQLVLQLE